MARVELPNIPFVEARNVGEKQKPTAIVLKLSFTTSEKGAALGIAQFHHSAAAPPASYHYITDEAETYRCVPTNVVACNSIYRAINVLMCAQPHEHVAMWEDATAKPVLSRSAALVADLMLAHKIPCRELQGKSADHWFDHKWRRRGGLIIRTAGTWPHEAFMADVKSQFELKAQ